MRATANERGRIDSGFERAEDGWHVVKFLEGISELKKKDKEGNESVAVNKQGDKLWKLPLVVDDENDESNEVNVDSIAAENKKGEQLVTDFLGATGLFDKFAKKFTGDVSVFSSQCMDKIKTSLPGQFMRIKTKQNEYTDKSGQKQIAVNIVGFGKMSDKIEDLEAALFPDKKGKGGSKKEAEQSAPIVSDDDF